MTTLQTLCVSSVLTVFLTGCAVHKPGPVVQVSSGSPAMPPFNPKPPAQPASDSEKKLDQGLRDLARSAGTGKIGAKAEEQQKVKVEIIANNATDIPKLKEALIRDGATIISDLGNHVWASIPVSSIGPLSQLDIVWTMALTRPTSSAQ